MENFFIQPKTQVIEQPSLVLEEAPDYVRGTKFKTLPRRTRYRDPDIFGNSENDHDVRLLFAEIASQDNVSDIIVTPGLPVLVKRKRGGLKAVTYRILQTHECNYLVVKLTGNTNFINPISNGECLSGQALMLDGKIVDPKDIEAHANQVSSGERARYRYEVVGCANATGGKSFSMVLRPLVDIPKRYDEIGLSEQFVLDCIVPVGMVIVSGSTGEGKSTTLAAIFRYILENETAIMGHLITHEDPIEITYDKVPSEHSAVIQSAIGDGQNIKSFYDANRAAMRRSPDGVMIGEIRDYATVDNAIDLSNTGHPVFATTHSSNVAAIVDRLIGLMPESIRTQKALELIGNLRVLISQKLIEDINGKKFAVREVLKMTPALREYLQKNCETTNDIVRKIKMIVRNGDFGAVSFESQGINLLNQGVISAANYRHLVEEVDEFDEDTKRRLDSY